MAFHLSYYMLQHSTDSNSTAQQSYYKYTILKKKLVFILYSPKYRLVESLAVAKHDDRTLF